MPDKPDELMALLDKSVNELNAAVPPPPVPREIPNFVHLSEELAKALEKAAQDQYTVAENNLKQAHAFAADIRAKIAKQNSELEDLMNRLKNFGNTVLRAHNKFHAVPADAEE